MIPQTYAENNNGTTYMQTTTSTYLSAAALPTATFAFSTTTFAFSTATFAFSFTLAASIIIIAIWLGCETTVSHILLRVAKKGEE